MRHQVLTLTPSSVKFLSAGTREPVTYKLAQFINCRYRNLVIWRCVHDYILRTVLESCLLLTLNFRLLVSPESYFSGKL